ncbi:hypothetical protein [Bacillus horti]|uniref:Bacterial transcription activator effector binding domain-containing protein n=1 Tax=Caldalkalibacillus horti TaxID=77523 RepID=A0ABT9VXV8_9BACI|nr:hypothetical protein [Bacillus horti]MDQ0165813.1 hypothetical protein [Bacillus horti]
MRTLEINQEQKTWTSAAQCMYAVLQYTDRLDLSLAEVMGFTSHAFRINIHPETVSPAGPTMFDPYQLVAKGLYTLGVHSITASRETPLPPASLEKTIKIIQRGIDGGFPVIGWDLFIPEFGLIYGYDHEKQLLFAKDVDKDGEIPYNKFDQRPNNHMYITVINDVRPRHLVHMLKDGLRTSIDHLLNQSCSWSSPEYKHGLAGYEAWLHAFKGEQIDPFGNAYNAEVVADARKFAHQFFNQLAQKWSAESPLDLRIIDLFQQAEQVYSDVATEMAKLQALFPFPQGGNPEDPKSRSKAVEYLEHAFKAEKIGVKILESLYQSLEEYEIEEFMTCRTVQRKFQVIGEQHHSLPENLNKDLAKARNSILVRDYEITSRFTIETVVYQPRTEEDKQIGYTTGFEVVSNMEQLPSGMVYVSVENEFAHIDGLPEQRDEMLEKLRLWVDEQGYEEDKNVQSIEMTLLASDDLTILDIFLPIKKK